MTQLVRYEAARAALQAAHDVDEAKDIRDKAQAMAAYAEQAKDTKLLEWATEIKVRAERRAGELLRESKVNGSRAAPGKPNTRTDASITPTLEKIGISKDQSSRWQKLASIPEKQFEQAVGAAKEVAGKVTTSALLRATKSPKSSSKPSVATGKEDPKDKKAATPTSDDKALAEFKSKYSDLQERYDTLAETCREQEDKLEMYAATELDEQQKMIAQLQKTVQRKDGEIVRLNGRISDLNNKCNALIRQVKLERKKK